MFKTLYGKLAIALVVLLSLIAIFYILLTLYSTRLYVQEVDQKFNRTLAANLLAGKDLMTGGRVNEAVLQEIFRMYMVINPNIEIYLLDAHGTILAFSAPTQWLASQSLLAPSETIRVGDLAIDAEKRKVALGDRQIELTAKEFDLLVQFAHHPGRVYTRSQLLDLVWGYGHGGYEHTVNSHINRLRAKIEQDPARPRYILTVWGVGYKFFEANDLQRQV